MNNSIPGLSTAVRLYTTGTLIKERAEGLEQIIDIFDSRENVARLQETASLEGGMGWVTFFQCLFQAVVNEKKAVLKRTTASTTADKRLSDAIGLVRKVVEKTYSLLSKKPFMALFTHMVTLLVHRGQIFPPAAIDYTKALKTLLSYPPHLECLDRMNWRIVVGVCWASLLGEPVTLDDGMADELEDGEELWADRKPDLTQAHGGHIRQKVLSTINAEVAGLLPILFSAPGAPLLSDLPVKDTTYIIEHSTGSAMMYKIYQFFEQYPNDNSAHSPIMRTLNLVLAEMELNARNETIASSLKLLPQLGALWTTRKKDVREQVVIAIRTILPFVTHKAAAEYDKTGNARETLLKIMDYLPKESQVRWGVEPLDLGVVRLKARSRKGKEKEILGPFETTVMSAGFDFTHECAMSWVIEELYADICYYLYDTTHSTQNLTPSTQASHKRRRIENSLSTLIANTDSGSIASRILHVQILTFFVYRYHDQLHLEAQADIRRALLDLLDEDDANLQSWAMVAFSHLATATASPVAHAASLDSVIIGSPPLTSKNQTPAQTQWDRVWAHATRKIATSSLSRAACHTATSLLNCGLANTSRHIDDIRGILLNIEIQGPPAPFDSVCAFLSAAIKIARNDATLYQMGLEDRILSWLTKWSIIDSLKSKSRMEQNSAAVIYRLLCELSSISELHLADVEAREMLPDCAIVDRLIEEHDTRPLRRLILAAEYPSRPETAASTETDKPTSTRSEPRPSLSLSQASLGQVDARSSRIVAFLTRSLDSLGQELALGDTTTTIQAPERVRKTLDLIVVASAFVTTLQATGAHVDGTCSQALIHLLSKIRPSLVSASHSTPGQQLMWSAFRPLANVSSQKPATWPILLNASAESSGIRRALLHKHEDTSPNGLSILNTLQRLIWSDPTLGAAFRDLVSATEVALKGATSAGSGFTSSIQMHEVAEDDFGEIKTAESEIMPLSREAVECRRTTTSLLSMLIRYRLCATFHSSTTGQPGRDANLLNAWLESEGPRFIQLGAVVCDALQDGLLRLNMGAVDAVLGALEEMVGSYGYSRSEGLLEVALAFIGHSAWVWVSPEASSSDLPERAITIGRFLLQKTIKGQVASWRVRLAVVVFLDEYLDYDPTGVLWSSFKDEGEMETDEAELSPFTYMQTALVDIDARVRIRAATSAAGLFHLPGFASAAHSDFYFQALNRQPGQKDHWDSFKDHLLWKLNCCIASVSLRATAMFHLYEIPPTTSTVHQHFQHGMHAVAERLCLKSIAELIRPYANIIALSQLGSRQKTIMQPFRLYGYPTKAAFGADLLSLVAPRALLEDRGFGMIKEACEASSTSIPWAIKHVLPASAAMAYAENVSTSAGGPDVETLVAAVFAGVAEHFDGNVLGAISRNVDAVIAHSLLLLDLDSSPAQIQSEIDAINIPSSNAQTFPLLIPDDDADNAIVALIPSASSSAIIMINAHLLQTHLHSTPEKIVFLAMDMLFKRLHETFLAAEERRYLRCLALIISLYPKSFHTPIILETFLREIIALIETTDYPDIVIQMVQWGFDQVSSVDAQLTYISDIMVQLGQVRQGLSGRGEMATATAAAIDAWLVAQVPIWTSQDTFRGKLDFAMAFWPAEVTSLFGTWTDPTFVDLTCMADSQGSKSFSSMTLCAGLARSINSGDRADNIDTFVKRTFWQIRPNLFKDGSSSEGVAGLLDLLNEVDGMVHAPSLDTVNELSRDRAALRFEDRYAKEPATLLRAILISKITELARHGDYEMRSSAIEALRRSHQTIEELLARTIPGLEGDKPLLSLLLPLEDRPTASKSNLDVLGNDDAWIKKSKRSESWAPQCAILLCDVIGTDDRLYLSFIPLLESQPSCAPAFLPWLVQALLTCGSAKRKDIAEKRSANLARYFTSILQYPTASIGAIETIIKVVLHLRGFSPAFRTGILAFNNWLDVDPILLSEAAIKCGAFASALLFLEMYNDDEKRHLDLLDTRVQNIMYEIYSNVEDPDGFYGIQTHDVKSALSRRLQHEKQSERAFGLNGAAFETGSNPQSAQSSALALMSNLHEMGFDHLSSAIQNSTRSTQHQNEDGDALLLELAWRTGDWELPVSTAVAQTSHGGFYNCLRAVHRRRDQSAARAQVGTAIRSEIGRLGSLGLERMAQIKEGTANLVCLREISLWLEEDTQRALSEGDREHKGLLRLGHLTQSMEFQIAERVSATRLSLLRAAHARESKFLLGDMTTRQTDTIVDLQKSVYLQLGRLARQDGKSQAAVNAITAVQKIEGGSVGSDAANDEFGHVLWDQKEHALAIQHIEQMINTVAPTTKSNGRLAVLLARNAHWTSVAKMRAPQEIAATFDRAYNMTKASKLGPAEQARVCHEYALFADSHHQALSNSPELDRLRANRDRTMSELEHIESTSRSSKSKSASVRTGESRRQDVLEDERALQDLERELSTYAKTAMKMYATSLASSNEFDDSVTRLCSMWLEHDESEEINRTFSGPVQAIPSYKFIFLGPQLAARLYKPKQLTSFNSSLNGLLLRMARDHPYHIIYQVITVAQGADTVPGKPATAKARRPSEIAPGEGRVPAAQELLSILHSDKERPLAKGAVDKMMLFTNAAVPWCLHNEPEKKSTKTDYVMAKGAPLLSIAHMKIPPPSVVPPIDLTKRYQNLATIQRYRSSYKILGGIHRPKRMVCVDSLGQHHFELFKGDDELRQDAVMEQVFEMTNRILSRDRKTRARDLRFRRYTVIPLPGRSGVMEFVGDSQAIGEFLKPAHTKYRAEVDHPPDHIRKRLEEVQAMDHTSSDLTRRYTELMKKFKPVMRHYFTEKHREPMAWFSMRLNYTRSVAVTSIVGHILGIGDRHCSNILIDKLTGELVHIDFGIVFEDGRRLRIPEKVPFRLTNDIVDGLGLTGVDGTFRQCSEHTLRVLRTSSDLILTVLEVFKHDPLYAWAADTEKLKRAQGGGRVEGQSSTATEKADRVLSKIRQKLRPDLSVEYTVNQLIQEARDPDNLAKIFVGWQPWL